MPLYDRLDLSDMGDFHSYVTGFDHESLMKCIQEQYLRIKNKCKYAPVLGENGCLEFAATLLLYRQILEKFYYALHDDLSSEQEKEELFNLFVVVIIPIGCAFMGASPTEFSNMADRFYEHTTLFTKREWSVVYLYLRDYHAEDIRKMEFNQGNVYSHFVDREKTFQMLNSAKGGHIEKIKDDSVKFL